MTAVAVAAAALSGCGAGGGSSTASSSSSGPTTTPSVTTAVHRHTRGAAGRRAPAGAVPVGRTQRVPAAGSVLAVTVTRVFPRLTDTGAALLPGTQAAGVQITISNEQGATYDSTASGDVSVITSTGMPAPLFIRLGACQTPLTDFESLIGVGETHSGCVGFSIPQGARVVGVRFSPHGRSLGSVTWR
jgi:hypothetical protein